MYQQISDFFVGIYPTNNLLPPILKITFSNNFLLQSIEEKYFGVIFDPFPLKTYNRIIKNFCQKYQAES